MGNWVRLVELGGMIPGLAVLARAAGRFGFSAIPPFLLGGLAFGHGGLLPLGASEQFIEFGAELGLLLLLLMLGLEYSAGELALSLRSSASSGVVNAVCLRGRRGELAQGGGDARPPPAGELKPQTDRNSGRPLRERASCAL